MTAESKLLRYERKAKKEGFQSVAGIDEAGRGPLAGPVVAAACIIPHGVKIPGVYDSKQLTAPVREKLYKTLTEHPKIRFGVGIVDHEEIDRINIARAAEKAMLLACAQLDPQPDLLMVDGINLPHPHLPVWKIIHGDSLSFLIAAASIIAKVTRDRLMHELDQLHPLYRFKDHKGYGTKMHLELLQKHGPSPIHRRTFSPVASLLPLPVPVPVPLPGKK